MGRVVSQVKKGVKSAVKNPVKAYTTMAGASVGGLAGIKPGANIGDMLTGGGGPGGIPKLSGAGALGGIVAPEFTSMRDAAGGLKSEFAFDPTKSGAFGQLREQAMSTGTSPWAQMQLQKQGFEEGGLKDLAAKQSMQATGQAQSGLARIGGLGGGARAAIARGGAQDLLMAKQGVARQGAGQRLDIGAQDIQRKQDLLGQVADVEGKAQEFNLGALRGEVPAQREFEMEKYRQQMAALGAKRTAEAQVGAAHAGNKPKK